jgi:hypothetical protein
MKDLDGQIFTALPEDFLFLLTEHLAGSMVWIDDAVAHLEIDVFDRRDLEVLQVLFG